MSGFRPFQSLLPQNPTIRRFTVAKYNSDIFRFKCPIQMALHTCDTLQRNSTLPSKSFIFIHIGIPQSSFRNTQIRDKGLFIEMKENVLLEIIVVLRKLISYLLTYLGDKQINSSCHVQD